MWSFLWCHRVIALLWSLPEAKSSWDVFENKKKSPEDLIFGVSRASSDWKRVSPEAGLQCCFFVTSKSQPGPCVGFWCVIWGFLSCVGCEFWLVLEPLGCHTNALCVCVMLLI